LILGEAALAQPRFEVVERASRRGLDDNVHVFRGADGRGARVADPDRYRGSADEHDLVEQRAERVGCQLQQRDAHAAAAARARC
jgi:hypothetical protein